MRYSLAAAVAALAVCAGLARAEDSPSIYGLHDTGGVEALPNGGFVLESTVLRTGHDPLGYLRAFTDRPGITVLVRLDYSTGGNVGTIPPIGPDETWHSYQDWANALAVMAQASPHVRHFIIGNEINLRPNWPTRRDGSKTVLTPGEYFACYAACYDAIKAVRPDALVMPSPVSPYNGGEAGVGVGNSLTYWKELTRLGESRCDAVALHCYTHGQDPALASDDRMTGFAVDDHHFNFRVYRDLLAGLPASLRSKPAYVTECDPGDRFVDVNNGWVQAIFHEIRDWNAGAGHQTVRTVCLYRWEPYDGDYVIKTKPLLRQDLAAAVAEHVTWRSPDPAPSGLPDLVAEWIHTDPAAPRAGDRVRFLLRVKNQGSGATPANVTIGAAYVIDGAQVSWGSTQNALAPGESVTLGTDGPRWIAQGGAHTFTALVDDVNRIQESNETNNRLSTTITVAAPGGTGLPDLVVLSATIEPAQPNPGDTVRFTVVVKNQGDAATPAGVTVGCGYLIDGHQVSWGARTGALGAGETLTLTTDGPAWTATEGAHTLKLVVDDVNRMAESDKTNNELSLPFSVGAPQHQGGGRARRH